MISKKTFLPVIGAFLIGGVLISATAVGAQNTEVETGFVQRIAQRFNLNQADVQKVFDETRQERRTQMQSSLEDKLNQAVKDSKITEAQKTAILRKHQEQQNNWPNIEQFKSQTLEQRRQAVEQRKSELETWAKENGLTLETLQSLIGHGGKGFGMGYGMKGMMWR